MAKPADLVELVAGRLYVVGTKIPLDGRASWAPPAASGYQPTNTYLVRSSSDVLIDPGMRYGREQVMAGLGQVLTPDAPIRVFLTRSQLDCVGNLGEAATRYRVQDIFTGGMQNPFDQFDAASATDHDRRVLGIGVRRSLEDPPVQIVNTTLRLLATYWGYDPDSKTLFTSDSFTHGIVTDPSHRPIIDSTDGDRTTHSDVRSHLLSTFWWLRVASEQAIQSICDQLRGLFSVHPIEIIAPGRGCVLVGEDVVRRHIEMLLTEIANAPRSADVQ